MSAPRWRCPKCGGIDLRVAVLCSASLIQFEGSENFQTEVEDSDHEWDGTHNMWCRSCRHSDASAAFATATPAPL